MSPGKPSLQAITKQDIEVLMHLHKKPFATYDELAEETSIPKTTVFEIVTKLAGGLKKEEGMEGQPSKDHRHFWVTAIPKFSHLGMITLEAIIEAKTIKKIRYLTTIAESHPYLWYYARVYGKHTGIYFQFRLPVQAKDIVERLLIHLKYQDKLDAYRLIAFESTTLYTAFDITKYNFETFEWAFDWNKWFAQAIHLHKGKDPEHSIDPFFHDDGPAEKTRLKQRDIAILNKLIINSRRTNASIKKDLEARNARNPAVTWPITDSTLSKRRKILEEEYINAYRVQLNPRLFDVVNPVLIFGHGAPEVLRDIWARVKLIHLPFLSTFKCSKFMMYWYIHISTTQLSELLHHLQERLFEVELYVVDYPKSNVYSFDHEMFNEKDQSWYADPGALMDKVLAKAEK